MNAKKISPAYRQELSAWTGYPADAMDHLITEWLPSRFTEVKWLLDKYMDEHYWAGTFKYSGHGCFWHHKYRHELKGCDDGIVWQTDGEDRNAIRREVHAKFLMAGLDVKGDSEQHDQIVDEVLGVTFFTQTGLENAIEVWVGPDKYGLASEMECRVLNKYGYADEDKHAVWFCAIKSNQTNGKYEYEDCRVDEIKARMTKEKKDD